MSAKKTKPDTKINPIAVAVGREINRIRTEADMNQFDFAEKVGIRQAMVSRYEAGHELPGPIIIMKIAIATAKNPGAVAGIIWNLFESAVAIVRRGILDPKPKTVAKPKAAKSKPDAKKIKAAKVSKKVKARAAALDQPDGKPKRSHSKKATVAVTPDPEPFIDIPPGAPEA